MRLFTSKRVRDIFMTLAQGDITQAALAKEMKVSTRTIRTDLKEVGDIVSQSGNRLIYSRKNGFSLQISEPEALQVLLDQCQRPWNETRSGAQRRAAMLEALLFDEQGVRLAEREAEWFISIYSLRNDITLLKRHVSLYQLRIVSEGEDIFTLKGSEIAFRRCIYDHRLRLTQATDEDSYVGPVTAYPDCKNALSHCLAEKRIAISDANLRFLSLITGIAQERMARGKWLRDFEFCDAEPGWKTLAEAVLQSLCANPAMPFSQSEIDFMAMNLVAFCTTTSSHNLVSEQYSVERTIMNHFLSYVSTSWFIHVNYDALSQATLLSHIRAMRIRVNNAITIVNPLLEQIKRHYPLMYELTLSAFSELDQFFKATVSADEIGYLVMHIGAILEDSISHQSGQGMRVLVVSDQGMASTRVVCQKILSMYPGLDIVRQISVEQYSLLPEVDEDIVISLVNIVEKNKRIILLPPFPERGQLENIKYYLVSETQPVNAMLTYFSADNFFVLNAGDYTRSSLITFLCDRLTAQGRVNDHFLSSVLDREARASTLLDDKIAIPHPLGPVAVRTAVSVAIFPEGIEWDRGKQVKLVFMLAISEDQFIDSMLIYDFLTNILDDDIIEKISQCKNYNEFITASKKYFL